MDVLIYVINVLSRILIVLVFVSVILSYVMDPYHPIRRGLDRIVDPLLSPIRRVVPPLGMIDISPIVLIILIPLASSIIIRILYSLR